MVDTFTLNIWTRSQNFFFFFCKCAPNRFQLQNKPVMAFGLVAITLCVGYLGYMHAMKENDQQLYEAIDSDGERYTRRKSSKWD